MGVSGVNLIALASKELEGIGIRFVRHHRRTRRERRRIAGPTEWSLGEGDPVGGEGLEVQPELNRHREQLETLVSRPSRVEGVEAGSLKPEAFGLDLTVDGYRRSGYRSRAEGTGLLPLCVVPLELLLDSAERGSVAQGPKPHGSRGGELGVGLQGKLEVTPRFGLLAQAADEVSELFFEAGNRIEEVELEEGCDLIVSRPSSVDLLSRFPGSIRELGLDPSVDILALGFGNWSVSVVGCDGIESIEDTLVLFLGQDLGVGEGLGVSSLKLDLIREKKPILRQAPLNELKDRVQGFLLFPK